MSINIEDTTTRKRDRTRSNGWAATCAGAVALLAVTAVLADDIELFVSTSGQAFQCEVPNVILLIDTSGSMDTLVETQEPWDPERVYDGCFRRDTFYYEPTAVIPDCESKAFFEKKKNACAAITGTEYTGEFQAWDAKKERWTRLQDIGEKDPKVECAADEGLHGEKTGDDDVYAVDGGAGPWSADEGQRISWGANASSVTVFDSNWLNWLQNPPTVRTRRLDIVKEVAKSTLKSMSNVNVAMMTFNRRDGGSMQFAMEPIESARGRMNDALDTLEPGGRTPLSESLFELGQYLRGGSIEFGVPPSGLSVAQSRQGGTLTSGVYLSPLNSAGQNTYIVLLTDGGPANDVSANDLIEALPDYGTLIGQPCDDAVDGSCLDAMAEYLLMADLRPDVPGQQNAITHTIGFGVDLDLLKNTARRGGGKYFIADNTASLTAALSDLAKAFTRSASLLTGPRIPINSFNRAERLDRVFVSVFEPAPTQHWPGNLKSYRLRRTPNGTILIDAAGQNVIDPVTGFFRETAVSFWSDPLMDGANAALGGAASQLPAPAARRIFSNVNGLGLTEVTIGNPDVTAALVGAPAAERDKTIAWARGIDSRGSGQPRLSVGDPLHVQPVTVSYGGDASSANLVAFFSTNDGYLHAVDADTGVELWSFVPRRLLGRLYELSLEEPSTNKEYGLDGDLRVVETAGGKKLLVFGMRRGGKALFAMDITSRTAPKLAWIIDGNHPDFLDLGQTWSAASPARVSVGGSVRDVILFGGGYDGGQDGRDFRRDTTGNAVYMVDALNGDLVWSAGSATARSAHDLTLARMNFSIPARLRVVDVDQDQLADRLYFGDMGGQIWRIDIVNGRGPATLAEGGVLASIGGADLDAPARIDARRFYNVADVVNVIRNGKLFTTVNIGSGYRAHPLDTATDEEFFSIRDFRSQQVNPTEIYGTEFLPTITRADLVDITDVVDPVLEDTVPGWRLRMERAGEKILSSSLTVSNVVSFVSFTPGARDSESCLPGGGQNRLYRVSVLDGAPLTNLDGSADADKLTKEDRYVGIGQTWDVPLELSFGPDGPCAGLGCFTPDGEPPAGGNGNGGGGDGEPDPGLSSTPHTTYWFPVTQP